MRSWCLMGVFLLTKPKKHNKMKTNQILTRKMGDFNVNQRTSDGMFNATELIKQWNNKHQPKLLKQST